MVVGDEDGIAIAPAERYDEIVARATAWQRDKDALLPLIAKFGSYMKAVSERDSAAKRQ
jgi:regulator of RNase E activity RraA